MPARRVALLAALTFVVPAAAHAAGPGSTVLIDRPTGLGALPFDGANTSITRSGAPRRWNTELRAQTMPRGGAAPSLAWRH